MLFCVWFSIGILRLLSVTVVDPLAGEDAQADTMAMGGIQGVITTVRRIIPVGTAGMGMGIIPAVIGGVLDTMLIRIGGGLIRMAIQIPITTPIPIILILIPIPIPIIFRRKAIREAIKPDCFPNSINLKYYNIQLSREKAGSF